MTSRERFKATLSHTTTDRIVIDFGSTPVTGMHVLAIKNLRAHYGLEDIPVKVTEPYQMLGEVDAELIELLGIDVIGIGARTNIIGFENQTGRSSGRGGDRRSWYRNFNTVPEKIENSCYILKGI
jgi:hypothetical protein